MAQWIFDANDVEEMEYAPIPEGNHRVRINSVTETMSRTNKQMFEIVLEVSGYAGKIWDYLVFDNTDETARKRTNTKINQIAQSFGVNPQIVVQNSNVLVGKSGGIRVKHSKYNGETKANVSYYLSPEKTSALPEWKNAGGTPTAGYDIIDDEVEEVSF